MQFRSSTQARSIFRRERINITSPASGYFQTDGVTRLNGTLGPSGGVRLDGGVLSGTGVIQGTLVNNAVVQPGASIGTLTVDGTCQSSTGSLDIEVAGAADGQFDRLPLQVRS